MKQLRSWLKGWRELAFIIFLAAVTALLVRQFFLAPYHVPTESMQPTLVPGDFIFVSQVAYGFRGTGSHKWASLDPQRGDIVTFYYPHRSETSYVKRVIGLAGDRIEFKNNKLIINGMPLIYTVIDNKNDNPNFERFDIYEEKFGDLSWRVIFSKNETKKSSISPESFVVPPGEVFLLADNRARNDDSQGWGTVPTHQIFGRVSVIWLSLNRHQSWAGGRFPSMRWERIFTRVH